MQAASLKFLFVATLGVAAAVTSVASGAETYDGVHRGGSQMERPTVAPGAIEIARAGNVYGDLAGSGVHPVLTMTASRADVRQEAIAAARMGNLYGDQAGAGAIEAPTVTASRADVRREAIAEARMGNVNGDLAGTVFAR